ncbi:hypothetical protein L873DRAFT_631949 [Choiromyces venosus 120613-1]|uniref:Uncharacterized protein n=1 Tax=Choiromyces venosus 120613-1 TaxID=1336337 RepID=A0A3N4JTC3_9PEZI|nr:hypothetical protein L873DRAFT_631949 [Choiromyces venosus 120613-1]
MQLKSYGIKNLHRWPTGKTSCPKFLWYGTNCTSFPMTSRPYPKIKTTHNRTGRKQQENLLRKSSKRMHPTPCPMPLGTIQ